MKTYKVTVREHKEYGGLGLVIDTGRDYFEPALAGFTCAHDILEHPVNPHPNGFVDELMALGGLLAGRIEFGWTSPYGQMLDMSDLQRDLSSLIDSSHTRGDLLGLDPLRRYVQDPHFMANLKNEVIKGVRLGLEEFYDDDNFDNDEFEKYDIETITSHIVAGYQAWKKRFCRFGDGYNIARTLFNSISRECEGFIKRSEEYDRGILYVDFESARAWIEQV